MDVLLTIYLQYKQLFSLIIAIVDPKFKSSSSTIVFKCNTPLYYLF